MSKKIKSDKKEIFTKEELKEIEILSDPVKWGEKYLRDPMYPKKELKYRWYQKDILQNRSRKKVIRAGRRIGKCKKINDLATTELGYISYKDLLNNNYKEKPRILTLNQKTLKLEWTDNYLVSYNGYKPIVNIKTKSGINDSSSDNHPYLIMNNDGILTWKMAIELKVGDKICRINKYNSKSDRPISIELAKILGYLIGDGSITNHLGFTNESNKILNDLENCIKLFNCKIHITCIKNKCKQIYISGNEKGKNDIKNKLVELKLFGCNSHTKFIPNIIFTATKEEKGAFIAALFDTDGWFSIQNKIYEHHKLPQIEIGISFVSEILIEQLRHLLLEFGIIGRIYDKKIKLNNKVFHTYQMTIHDKQSIINFYNNIKLIEKQENLDKIQEINLQKSNWTQSYFNKYPKEINNYIKKIIKEKNIDIKSLFIDKNERYRNYYSIDKYKVKQYNNILNDDYLKKLIDSNICFDEIKNLSYTKSETVNIETYPNNTLIFNDIITHNSISIISEILWKMFTNSYRKIVLITPYQSQISELWDVMENMVETSPHVKSSIKRKINNPQELQLYNGSSLKCFTAGSKSSSKGANIRSISAHDIYLDEADYLGEEALEAINALFLTSSDTSLCASSTPTGRRETFWTWCSKSKELGFSHFHYPSSVSPVWVSIEDAKKRNIPLSESTEYLYRNIYSEAKYLHEFEAEFGNEEQGVFKSIYIDNNIYDFRDDPEKANLTLYDPGYKQNNKNTYVMGIDWNNSINGTQVVITEYLREPTSITYYNEENGKVVRKTEKIQDKYRLFYRCSLSADQSTQIYSVKKIVELVQRFKIDHIYCDLGFGQCVDPNTLIYTNDGIKKIIDIKRNDLVFTHEGLFKKVLNKTINNTFKISYRIKPKKCLPTILSEEHPFLTYRINNRFKYLDEDIKESDFNWRRCPEIDPKKDFIAIPKTNKLKNSNKYILDLKEFLGNDLPNLQYNDEFVWLKTSYPVKNKKNISICELSKKCKISTSTINRIKNKLRNEKKLTKYENISYNKFKNLFITEQEFIMIDRYINILSEDFQRIYGWYLAEGNCNKNSVEFSQSFNNNDLDFNLLKLSCNKIFPKCFIKEYHKMVENKNWKNKRALFIFSKIVSKLFEKLGGKYSKNKHIFPELMQYANNLGVLVYNFIVGDGCLRKIANSGIISISITSNSLIFQLRQIFIDNGILPSLYFIKRRKDNYLDQMRIDITGNEYILNKVNNFLNTKINNLKRINRRNYFETKNYFLVPISKFELISERKNLVDIQIEDSKSFCGNGIVLHNTNIELLHEYGEKFKELKLRNKIVPIDFGSTVDIQDPMTKKIEKQPVKPFIVYTVVHEMEKGNFILPISEDDKGKLLEQIRAYTIKKHSQTGMPIFSQGNDHILIAWLLSVVGFHMEYSTFIHPEVNPNDSPIKRVLRPTALMPYLANLDRKTVADKNTISSALNQVDKPKPMFNTGNFTTDPRFYRDKEQKNTKTETQKRLPWGSQIVGIKYFNPNKIQISKGSPSGRKLI